MAAAELAGPATGPRRPAPGAGGREGLVDHCTSAGSLATREPRPEPLRRWRRDCRRPGDPLPGRARRTGRQGRQLRRPARRRRPGRARRGLRRRGGRRAHLPRHLRLRRGSGDHPGGGPADRGDGVHPADRGRRGRPRRRCRRAAAGRRRQGGHQHRRHPPTGGDRRDHPSVRQPGAGAVGRRAAQLRTSRRASRSPPTAVGPARASTRSRGPGAGSSSGWGRSCSTRWTPTAPPPASTWR